MKKYVGRLVAALAVVGFVVSAAPRAAHAQNVQGFAANWLYFSGFGGEANTNVAAAAHATGGKEIYTNNVTVPAAINVLFVRVDAVGDLADQSNSILIGCLVDGVPCNDNASAFNGSPAGWVEVQELTNTAVPSNDSDQTIHYTWCTPIHKLSGPTGTVHHVSLRLASGDGTHFVFVEQMQIFVSGVKISGKNAANACTNAGTP